MSCMWSSHSNAQVPATYTTQLSSVLPTHTKSQHWMYMQSAIRLCWP